MTKQQTFSYDDLFVQLGIANLSAAEKEVFAKSIEENVEGRIMVRILNSLSDEDKTAFDACKTDAEIEAFLKAKNIDMSAIAVEEALTFREELIKDASFIEGKLSAMGKK
ncbi:MAG: hypothetical protein US89_C0014G0015 [Candidatus Peregrinibacteria bacterium GW2011_GWF2_38_29]|nr:MAG: hypothetical protein US89_C0014G0015 [Candidatus Peregrinibacteria bacterium GW2011_GWF2_38_29]HBB02577.1 hypothetical protein [Candidatus Peregrinibacteria bacterium]